MQENSSSPIQSGMTAGGIREALKRFIAEEKKNSPLIFWSFLVGAFAGILGGVFRGCLQQIASWHERLALWSELPTYLGWVIPALFSGLLVFLSIYLVRRFAPETSGSGVQEIEGALDGIREIRWRRVLPVKFFAGLLSLGGGLVLGREGPTIQMGGSLGKMVSEWFKSSKDEAHVLMAAGAAAGLAAAFNAPLAGILFVIEEMRPQFKYTFGSFQAVMVASATGDFFVRVLMGQEPVIHMPIYHRPPLESLWIFLIFGAFFGFFGFFFNKFLLGTLDFFGRRKGWAYVLTGIYVGAFIGFLGWLFPGTTGGGYQVIPSAIDGDFTVTVLLLLFLFRYGTTVLSYGSGAPGGIFAPMLALGTLFGLWFGHVTDWLFPHLVEAPGVFVVAGMAALFSATVRAPLTGIALAIEMTGNYFLILPLIITCLSATLVAQGLGGRPVYTLLLERTIRLANQVAAALKKPETPLPRHSEQ